MAADQSPPLMGVVEYTLDPPASSLPPLRATVVTVGCFDGVHLGHRYLVQQLVQRASETDLLPTVVTFEPHPRRILRPDEELKTLTDTAERAALLREAGAELVVTLRFTPQLAAALPQEFTAWLADRLRMRELWVGTDFALGRSRSGTVPVLQSIGRSQGFEVYTLEPYRLDGELVKSSIIRQALLAGNLDRANRLLGRPYAVVGTVVRGAQRGRELGFPTANIAVPEDRLLPAFGVYAVRVRIASEASERAGVANLGLRPTVDGQSLVLEVHLFDFAGDLYGAQVRVAFIKRLREERRFGSLDELRAQIARDAAQAQAVLSASA